jgi:hypothetical protein
MQQFLAHAGLDRSGGEGDEWRLEPDPEMTARMRSTAEHFFARLLCPTAFYRPEIETLRAGTTRIVVAGGTLSKGNSLTARPRRWLKGSTLPSSIFRVSRWLYGTVWPLRAPAAPVTHRNVMRETESPPHP